MSVCPVRFNSGIRIKKKSICTTCLATWKRLHNYKEKLEICFSAPNLSQSSSLGKVVKDARINMPEILVACRVCI